MKIKDPLPNDVQLISNPVMVESKPPFTSKNEQKISASLSPSLSVIAGLCGLN
jgi:hypothetical protein